MKFPSCWSIKIPAVIMLLAFLTTFEFLIRPLIFYQPLQISPHSIFASLLIFDGNNPQAILPPVRFCWICERKDTFSEGALSPQLPPQFSLVVVLFSKPALPINHLGFELVCYPRSGWKSVTFYANKGKNTLFEVISIQLVITSSSINIEAILAFSSQPTPKLRCSDKEKLVVVTLFKHTHTRTHTRFNMVFPISFLTQRLHTAFCCLILPEIFPPLLRLFFHVAIEATLSYPGKWVFGNREDGKKKTAPPYSHPPPTHPKLVVTNLSQFGEDEARVGQIEEKPENPESAHTADVPKNSG